MKIRLSQLKRIIRETVEEVAGAPPSVNIPEKDPASIPRGPTYGHTSIGVRYAPEGMDGEEAAEHLRKMFYGSPLWHFEINRDPKNGEVYAYYEMDNS